MTHPLPTTATFLRRGGAMVSATIDSGHGQMYDVTDPNVP